MPNKTASSISEHIEDIESSSSQKLNWLRAAVLGANDGIVSIAGLVVGVASATDNTGVIFMAGLAGVIAGALSMAAGEFVSVSSQRDAERALLIRETKELATNPTGEKEELARIYQAKGLQRSTAALVAEELSAKDAFRAHAEAELGINPDELTNPWHATFASAAAFLTGAAIPLIIILVSPPSWRILVTFSSVVAALALTGMLSAQIGKANMPRATLRVVAGGVIAMITTFIIGKLFNASGI
jgi:vacuolar iron transporter family protein